MIQEEEDRAAEYRAQQLRRAEARVARLAALAGDPGARTQLEENWRPIREAQSDPDGTLGRRRGAPGTVLF